MMTTNRKSANRLRRFLAIMRRLEERWIATGDEELRLAIDALHEWERVLANDLANRPDSDRNQTDESAP